MLFRSEQGQAALMNDMINKKYDAIIASPISDGNLVQATKKAQAAGIPVINTIGGFCQVMDVFVGLPFNYFFFRIPFFSTQPFCMNGSPLSI